MLRSLTWLIACSSLYGFSVGMVHSRLYALRNLLKFPLLFLVTAAICAPAYFLFARLITRHLTFGEVQRLVLQLFRHLSLLLVSLSPVCLFLALTLRQPDEQSLQEYPFFLGLNVALIALCGSLSLVQQARKLLTGYALCWSRALLIILLWLSLSLAVGGQWAWYLRPFFGISTISGESTSFCEGRRPDFRGASNFYEAVYNIIDPPPLPPAYQRLLRRGSQNISAGGHSSQRPPALFFIGGHSSQRPPALFFIGSHSSQRPPVLFFTGGRWKKPESSKKIS